MLSFMVSRVPRITAIVTVLAVNVVNCFAIWFLWHTPWAVLVVTVIGSIALLVLFRDPRITFIYCIIALSMTLTEILAVHAGIWTYTTSTFLNIPVFVLSVWGNIGIIAASMYKLARIITGEPMPVAHTRHAWHMQMMWLVFFAFITLAALLLAWESVMIATALVIIIKTAQILISHHTQHKTALIVFIGAIIGGAIIGEITSVALGIWHYNTETLFGLPLFIYITWGSTGLIIAELYVILSSPFLSFNHARYNHISHQ